MVNVTKGVLVECDPAMKQFLLNLDENTSLGKKFVLHDLDEKHLFIEADMVTLIQEKVDELMERMNASVRILKIHLTEMSASASMRAREAGKVLDQLTRARRQKKALEALEQDNFHEEPHADLVMSKRAPKFEESLDPSKPPPAKKRKTRPTEYYRKYRKTIPQMIEEDIQKREDGTCPYANSQVSSSKYPRRHFCCVCGFEANYTCVQCGVHFCSIKCNTTHQDTRCQKWIV